MSRDCARTRFERFEHLTDLPMAFLALLVVPALILEAHAISPRVRLAAAAINWTVWIAFCVEYAGKLWLAERRRDFVRQAWFDVVLIVLSPPFLVPAALQGARAARAVRALRVLRIVRAAAMAGIGLREASEALRHRQFHYVALVTGVIVSVGAIGMFSLEGGVNPSIRSMGDAFWWSMVTTTTVGYGDVSPITPEGRLIAVGLMLVGIGFIGVFTATVTSFFVRPASASDHESVAVRLDRIEKKLDDLLRDPRQPRV